MQFRRLAAAAAAVMLSAVTTVGAYGPDQGPLPQAYPFKCADWCGPIVTLSQGACVHASYGCFCDKPHMKKLVPLCEACSYNARHVGNGVDFYPAIDKVVKACDFKTTSVTRGVAAATAAPALAGGAMAVLAAAAAL